MNLAKAPNRILFARIFYGLAVIFIVMRWKSHLLLSQLGQPELISTGTDYTYILFAFSGVTRFLGQHYRTALLFDICFTASAIFAFLFPANNKFSIAFTVLLTVYTVVGYSFLCFHKHNLTGLWIASLMFLPGTAKGFSLLFYWVRYYCLFVYASSGFWKFYRGTWNAPNHLLLSLKNDALQFLVQHPVSVRADMMSWLIIHPAFLDNLMLATCVLQFSFILGFFTRRLDWFFFLFAIAFHVLALIFLRAFFLEFSLILITLLPLKKLYDSGVEVSTASNRLL